MATPNRGFQRRYPAEMRERAIRMLRETIAESGERKGAVSRVARQLGIGTESLRHWVKRADIDNAKRPGVTSAEQQRITELERENRELRRANEILKAAASFLARELDPRLPKCELHQCPSRALGIEPICRTHRVAPSTYYALVARQPSARQLRDDHLSIEITRVHRTNFAVYGIEKVWRQLNHEGHQVGRDRVARLMADLELSGVVRGKRKRTTYSRGRWSTTSQRVERQFTASAPNQLRVADLTYVSTWRGFVYVAFVIDVFSRFILGWRVSNSLHTELALDALEMAIWRRQQHDLTGLIHHSDRRVQDLASRYTERLTEAGTVCSVGSRGDSYDNAPAKAVNGLYKAELIRKHGPWRSLEQVELATAEWVDWWNHARLHSAVATSH
jgi:putative transposase